MVFNGFDVFGSRAAAAAHKSDGQVEIRLQKLDVFLGGKGVFPRLGIGQTGIQLDGQGQGGMLCQPLQGGQHFVGAQRAVDADGVGAHTLQHHAHGGHIAAQKGAAGLLIGHGHQHRQVGVLLGGQNGTASLGQIHHGLEDDGVGPGVLGGHAHFFINLVALVKGHGAHGLHQLAAGAGRHGHLGVGAPGGVLGAADGHRDDLLHRMTRAGQLEPVCAKGVGIDQVGTGLHIHPVDGGDRFGLLQTDQLGSLAQLQALFLQHGAHGTV